MKNKIEYTNDALPKLEKFRNKLEAKIKALNKPDNKNSNYVIEQIYDPHPLAATHNFQLPTHSFIRFNSCMYYGEIAKIDDMPILRKIITPTTMGTSPPPPTTPPPPPTTTTTATTDYKSMGWQWTRFTNVRLIEWLFVWNSPALIELTELITDSMLELVGSARGNWLHWWVRWHIWKWMMVNEWQLQQKKQRNSSPPHLMVAESKYADTQER